MVITVGVAIGRGRGTVYCTVQMVIISLERTKYSAHYWWGLLLNIFQQP